MRILIYCDDPGYGGTAVNAGLLTGALGAHGFEIALAAGVDLRGDASDAAFHRIDYDTQRFYEKTRRSRNEPEDILLASRPDLVLFCDGAPDSSLAAKAVCRDWGVPYVALVNYVAQPADDAPDRREAARALAGAVAVVAVSRENRELLRRYYGVDHDRSRVIYNGRPDCYFHMVDAGCRQGLRAAQGLGPDDLLCLTVARYEPRKGYGHLLEAIRLLSAHPLPGRPRFAWIGQSMGDGGAVVAEQVAASGVSDRIALLGERKDVRAWLAAADLFILPSESEGMPLCIIEAMAQGVPVLATAVSGIPEQLHGAGVLLPDPRRDPAGMATALAAALAALAADPVARRALGQAGRQRAWDHFRAETMVAHYAALLRALAPELPRPRWPRPGTHVTAARIPVGRDVAIGDDDDAMEYLKEGWSHGEGKGRWTDGDQARLAFALPRGCENGFVLDWDMRPFLGPRTGALTVRVRLDGRVLATVSWPGAGESARIDLLCPPGAGPREELEFEIDGASSPAAHGLSGDSRRLGLWVSRLRVSPLRGCP